MEQYLKQEELFNNFFLGKFMLQLKDLCTINVLHLSPVIHVDVNTVELVLDLFITICSLLKY